MKKLLILAAVMVLGSSLAFAAGRGQQGGAGAKTVIRLGIWPEDTNPGGVALHEGYVKLFNQKYPDITVQPATYPYGTDTFVPLAEAGQLPTIFSTWFTEPEKIINGGYVKDITDELRALGWDAKMEDSVKSLVSRNGRIYGFPSSAYALGLMVNVPLFREAGLVDSNGIPIYPRTWEELALTAQTIKQKTGVPGFAFPAISNHGGWFFTNIAWCFGAELAVQRDGRWIARLNSPEAVQAMSYLKDLRWKYDALTADAASENAIDGFKKVGVGTAAMAMGANGHVSIVTRDNGLPPGDLALVPIPAGPKGQYALLGGDVYFFEKNASSEQVSAALYYLELMGKAPVVTEAAIAGLRNSAQLNREQGVPVIPGFPVWNDAAYLKAQEDARNAYANVDMRLYNDFYAAVRRPGVLHAEEPVLTQDIYAELDRVCQAVFTDRNANVQTLMDGANQNIQRLMDSQVNR